MSTKANPRRVLWLTKGLGRGGAERLIVDAASMMDRRRFDVEVAYLLPWKDGLVSELESEGIAVHCLQQRSARDVSWTLRLRRLVSKGSYELVHTHAPLPAVAARMVLRRPRPRLVHTEHNVWDRYRWATYWTNAITYRRNQHVIAVSDAVARSAAARRVGGRGRRPPIEVLHHGVRLANELPPTGNHREKARMLLSLGRDIPVVGTVANLTAKKEQSTLLQAFRVVIESHPEAVLVMIGAGVLDEQLRREADHLGISHAVLWAGSRGDVSDLLPAFDVFALTSRFEGLPISMLEAMAAGLPVVVTPVGGIGEVVTDGREGWLTPVGDVSATADRLVRLLKDPGLRASMGACSLERVRDFDLTPAVHRIEAIYDTVLPT